MSGYIGNIPVPQATQTRDAFVATSGQTVFATGGYTPSYVDVYLNGVKLVDGDDFTATNGSDVVLAVGATAGDQVEVVAFTAFNVMNVSYNDLLDVPVFATVATTGSYTDLSNIPANIVTDAAYVHTDNNYTTTEKSKLAGVEAGATADQTAAEILTAIKTVDGAGSGLDADTLDGQHASAFLTGNQTITLTGDVSGSGTTSISVTIADDSHNHVWGNIDGASVNAWGGLRHSTASGYIDFGPANTSYAHIYTDRPAFYLNKALVASAGLSVVGTCSATAFSGSGASLTNLPAPTTAQVGSATAGLSDGAVGAYALLYYYGTGATEGSTMAGSSLYKAGFHRSVSISADGDSSVYVTRGGTAQAGTWRCMGRTNFGPTNTYSRVTLWLRIS